MPNKPKPHIISAINPPLKTRSENNFRATIGSAMRPPIATKASPSARAEGKPAGTDVQPGLGDHRGAEGEGQHADRDVDEEDPLPARMLAQQSAEQRSDR